MRFPALAPLLLLLALAPVPAGAAGFSPLFAVERGTTEGRLDWAVHAEGRLLTGNLTGPAAFATLPEGDLVALDTRNARIVQFSAEGKTRRTIDLAAAAKAAGLPGPVVATALAVDAAWRLHVGDEGNARILSFDGGGAFLRATGGPGDGPDGLAQINRIHATGGGELWAEDHARQRTVVFGHDGRHLRTLDGFTNLIVDPFGNFTLPLWRGDPTTREFVRHAPDGTPVDSLGTYKIDGTIRFIRSVGADAAGNQVYALDTDRARLFVSFRVGSGAFAAREFPHHEPGIAVATPEWVTPAGALCRVAFTPDRMTVEILRDPFAEGK